MILRHIASSERRLLLASRVGCIYAYPMRLRYIPPAAPTLRSAPPSGEQRLHEVKFDGWRIQLHKQDPEVVQRLKNSPYLLINARTCRARAIDVRF
jgi:hypothetical protein